MKTWQALLREGDPVAHEPALTVDSVARMRRDVLAAAEPQARSRFWTMRVIVASALGLLIAIGAWPRETATRQPLASTPEAGDRATAPASDGGGRRQLQFSTPGGTRVIWVFDSNFNTR